MKAGPYRLPVGGADLNRERRITFRFDGKPFEGFEGDTLASALLANGVRTVGRSFKYRRPRGVYSSGVEEPNAFVQIGTGSAGVPSTRATLTMLNDGVQAFSHANLKFDSARILDFTALLWTAGFYNKTFIWPSWHAYEWLVRRMAGFGRTPCGPDPDRYEVRNLHCDVLVIGGGAAGVEAANTAAAVASERVLLVEQRNQLAGTCSANVDVLRQTTAVGYYDHNIVTLVESVIPARAGAHCKDGGQRPSSIPRERYWIVRTKRVVLATGAIEQPLIFCNNDRPGIMLAGAAHQYLQRYAIACGRRIIIATNNDSAYAVARDLKQAGVKVVTMVDTRHEAPQELAAQMRTLSIPLLEGWIPVQTTGFTALSSVSVGRLSRDCRSIESIDQYTCDALAVSGGWNPTLHLYSQADGKLTYDVSTGALSAATSGALWPAAKHPSIDIVGGAAAQASRGPRISPLGKKHRQFVDLRHDVTVADLELAVREGYTSIEHVKRYTTVGMAADQGKTSNVASLEITAKLRGIEPSQLGHTTFRPPFAPVTLGAIVGRTIGERFAPSRRTPMYDWHVAHGGVVEDYGEWKRAAVYLRHGESRHQAIRREAHAVRTSAGLFDSSSLGKIELRGPDAITFLDKFYINNLKTLQPGRTRYGIMLRESGVILDDGTVVLLAPDHLLITTTSGNASRVAQWLEEWRQCEWPHLRVAITQVTEQWATISLAGPKARDILSKLRTDIDLSNEAFPHLSMREGRLLGHPARICRVSFTGELTYEINVPTRAGQQLWDVVLATGTPDGLQPLGLDALLLLRLEKGFLHIGTDTNGTTVPDDVGWGKVAASKQADFIGKRSLLLPENARSNRLQLVGLVSIQQEALAQHPAVIQYSIATGSERADLIVGSHLRIQGSENATDGWITSAGRSVLTGEPIAMAMLRGGRLRIGEHLSVHDGDTITGATIANLPFFDPTGERMNA